MSASQRCRHCGRLMAADDLLMPGVGSYRGPVRCAWHLNTACELARRELVVGQMTYLKDDIGSPMEAFSGLPVVLVDDAAGAGGRYVQVRVVDWAPMPLDPDGRPYKRTWLVHASDLRDPGAPRVDLGQQPAFRRSRRLATS